MKLLVDTHVFLWRVQLEPIPPRVRARLENASNDLFVGVVPP